MRHGKKINHLSRKTAHRKAMLANMATSLILHKRIKTTVAKAKALKLYVEPLITKSKNDTTHSRRVVFSYLRDKYAVTELFREVSVKVADRPGGYTRILRTGNRLGDNAEMCMIELVDYNENMLTTKETKKKSTRRRKPKKAETNTVTEKKEIVEAPKEAKAEPKAKATSKKDDVKATPKKDEAKAKKTVKKEEPKTEKVSEKPKAKKAAPKKEEKNESEEKSSDEKAE